MSYLKRHGTRRRAVGRWYASRSPDALAYQVVKHRRRNGVTHRDLLRLAHPAARVGSGNPTLDVSDEHAGLFEWIVRGGHTAALPRLVEGFVRAQDAATPHETAALVRELGLPREALLPEHLTSEEVWEALLEDMPMTALVRNLATMTPVGVLAPGSAGTAKVVAQLGDAGSVAGVPGLSPRDASAALALVTAATESRYEVAGFFAGRGGWRAGRKRGSGWGEDGLTPLAISPRQRLDDAVKVVSDLPFGGTDCALPMLYAQAQGREIDTFVIYTDSETWAGLVHPAQALRDYRRASGIDARLVVVGMVSNGFSIADPADPGMLDVVGFDAATPQLISDFGRGAL
jgi:60 kDa SS-A/Ro ribonucleoprotein